jgi:hypothetical protein
MCATNSSGPALSLAGDRLPGRVAADVEREPVRSVCAPGGSRTPDQVLRSNGALHGMLTCENTGEE